MFTWHHFTTSRIFGLPLLENPIHNRYFQFFLILSLISVTAIRAQATETLYPFKKDSQCIYINSVGVERIKIDCAKPQLRHLTDFDSELLPRFIDGSMGYFDSNRAPVQLQTRQWGYIDRTGKVVIQAQYEDADQFSEGFARIRKNQLYGYIDLNGKSKIEPKFERSGRFSQGLAFVQCSDHKLQLYGYIDMLGKQKLSCKYQRAFDFSNDGLAKARMWDLYGFINTSGKPVLNFSYKFAGNFKEGVTVVMKDENFSIINRFGKSLYKIPNYNIVGDFQNGLAPFRDSKTLRFGYLKSNGQVVISPTFFEALNFYEGLALVQGPKNYNSQTDVDNLSDSLDWFYIDSSGRRVYPN